MNELLFTALDVACIINNLDLPIKTSANLIRRIWQEDNNFLTPNLRADYKKFLLDVRYWCDYLHDKITFDAEFPAIQADCDGLLDNENFMADNFNMDLFFKALRVKILFGKKNYTRMKLRTLLRAYGYRRRSKEFLNYVKSRLKFYKIKSPDLEKISLDDMITFRI